MYEDGLSVSYRKSRFACSSSLTSRFGFVLSSVYSLVASGFDESFVNGLNHDFSSVSNHVDELTRLAWVMIRDLFLAGPRVIRIVKQIRSAGASGLRALPLAETRMLALGALSSVMIPGKLFSASALVPRGASHASQPVVAPT